MPKHEIPINLHRLGSRMSNCIGIDDVYSTHINTKGYTQTHTYNTNTHTGKLLTL